MMKRRKLSLFLFMVLSVGILVAACGGGSGDSNSSNNDPNQANLNNINTDTDCIFLGAFDSVLGFIELNDLVSNTPEELEINVEVVGVLENTFDIEAIVYDFINNGSFPDPGRLFAADNDILLEVNTASPQSELIGVFGTVVLPGPVTKNINNVDGLAYDPNADVYYGSNRELGQDYIFSFNVIDDGNDTVIDNVQLLTVLPSDLSCGPLSCTDVDDLAYDIVNDRLLGVINRNGTSTNKLVEIDTTDGTITEIGAVFTDGCRTLLQDIEGLGVTLNGRIFATTGVEGNSRNDFFELEIDDSSVPEKVCATLLEELSNSDTEGLDCSIDSTL